MLATRDSAGVSSKSAASSWRSTHRPVSGRATESSTSLVAAQEGSYKLRVSTSDDRCASEDTIQITRFVKLVMPNAFSPNGDGLNDTWEIRNLNSLTDAEVFVFNRSGALIYYADKNGQPWDGTYENQKVLPGMYRYLIRAPGRQPMHRSWWCLPAILKKTCPMLFCGAACFITSRHRNPPN